MGKIALVFIIVMASATFYMTSSTYKSDSETTSQRTWLDDTGKLHVMGITLGESTVRDAEIAFRSRTDAAIFMYPIASDSEEPEFDVVLEAYFPSIADHSKVLLKLEVDKETLETMRKRSSMPRMYPNGVVRMNLATEDVTGILNLKVRELTLIPSVQITTEILQAQFGDALDIQQTSESLSQHAFPNIGLIASIDTQGKDKLVFSNPEKTD